MWERFFSPIIFWMIQPLWDSYSDLALVYKIATTGHPMHPEFGCLFLAPVLISTVLILLAASNDPKTENRPSTFEAILIFLQLYLPWRALKVIFSRNWKEKKKEMSSSLAHIEPIAESIPQLFNMCFVVGYLNHCFKTINGTTECSQTNHTFHDHDKTNHTRYSRHWLIRQPRASHFWYD